VPAAEMDQFGIVDCDASGNIVGFREKPPVETRGSATRLASMGLYVFDCAALIREVCADAERTDSAHDFGKDVIPRMVESASKSVAYDFSTNTIPDMHDGQRGYWRDVGSIDMYWRTSEI
jgi:glucose-1-phosphate adenylyltransferase